MRMKQREHQQGSFKAVSPGFASACTDMMFFCDLRRGRLMSAPQGLQCTAAHGATPRHERLRGAQKTSQQNCQWAQNAFHPRPSNHIQAQRNQATASKQPKAAERANPCKTKQMWNVATMPRQRQLSTVDDIRQTLW